MTAFSKQFESIGNNQLNQPKFFKFSTSAQDTVFGNMDKFLKICKAVQSEE
jgi:hypothetical protein